MHQVMLSNPESLITGRLWSAGSNSTAAAFVQSREADYRESVLHSVQETTAGARTIFDERSKSLCRSSTMQLRG
jgi:hypothetical protein